ncbi:MAG: 1-acyl-sn-glycerol-3-phosphate acyltransferase [Alphaproteobacteria bacterium]|nr:1-acyl-sn-glycerol-3-phosphate acyltransferase [Alphaproteobacteria bacterium]
MMVREIVGRIRIALFLTAIVPVTLFLIPPQWVMMKFRLRAASWLPLIYHRFVSQMMGLRVRIHGAPLLSGPRLFLSNHVSWLDIVAFGSVLPLSFVARADVASWPIFGLFAKLQQTVFVDRTRKMATKAAVTSVAERFSRGDAILLFAEGTTSDGNRVLDFRSALLGALSTEAVADQVRVQPVALLYRNRAGMPLRRFDGPEIAWYGDMDLLPHFAGILKGAPIVIDIWFGDPLHADQMTDRKVLALTARDQIRAARTLLARGRDMPSSWPVT